MEGIVSTSGDVYSYGVILLETFTRKKPTDDIFGAESNLKLWVRNSIQANAAMEVVDSTLIRKESKNSYTEEECLIAIQSKNSSTEEEEEECLLAILHVGLNCMIDSPQGRIGMRDVVNRLKMIKLTLESIIDTSMT